MDAPQKRHEKATEAPLRAESVVPVVIAVGVLHHGLQVVAQNRRSGSGAAAAAGRGLRYPEEGVVLLDPEVLGVVTGDVAGDAVDGQERRKKHKKGRG